MITGVNHCAGIFTVTNVDQEILLLVAVTVQVHAETHVINHALSTVTAEVVSVVQVNAGCGFITVQL